MVGSRIASNSYHMYRKQCQMNSNVAILVVLHGDCLHLKSQVHRTSWRVVFSSAGGGLVTHSENLFRPKQFIDASLGENVVIHSALDLESVT